MSNLLLELHLFLIFMHDVTVSLFSAWDDFGFVHIAVIHLKTEYNLAAIWYVVVGLKWLHDNI